MSDTPQGIDFTTLLQVANFLGIVVMGILRWLEKRNDTTSKQIADLAKRVTDLDGDVTELSATVKGAPTHDHLAEVYRGINQLSSTVNQLVGENRGQTDTLRLILNEIMKKGMGNG